MVAGAVDSSLTDTGDPNSPELANTVTVSSDTVDGDSTNNSATETTDVVESADVVLTKIGQGSDITPGEQATFSVEVVNVGPSDADAVVVTDTLPAGLTFVSASGASCDVDPVDASVIHCDLGTLAAGSPAVVITIIVDVAPDVAGDVVNEAEVVSATPDPVPENNGDTSEDPTSPDADLSIEKVDLVDPALAGAPLTYLLTVRNGGPSVANNVLITDQLPAEVGFASATFTTGTGTCSHDGSATGGTIDCLVTSMAPGDVLAIEVVVDVPADTTDAAILTNSATVSSDSNDPNPGDNTDTEDTVVEAIADVAVTKVASRWHRRPR